MKQTDWAQFKNIVDNRKLDVIMLTHGDSYELFCNEGAFALTTIIDAGTSDCEDFEANYKSKCNPKKLNVTSAATPINEHGMEPWGCVKGCVETYPATGQKYVCAITLSNKSENGLTFNYQEGINLVPEIGNYVFQENNTKRSWVTAIDEATRTITFERADLDNGDGLYSKGYYIDCEVRDWAEAMYLWGVTMTVREYEYEGGQWIIESNPCGDFCEFSVVDKLNLFKMDAITQTLFGVDAAYASPYLEAIKFEDNGEFDHWTKYYDESWVLNCDNKYIHTPDGAPGQLMPLLYLRLAFFSTELENHKYHIYLDYYATSMS